ncbi:hypothetical protein [Mucilaginibacter gotjawali]|uniref:Uncharacterized protein n=2 Tax=Mucilaginibacter gotjawali TaxID=1550579 RepID=A0A839SM30_9SPHI|nr:hypothetical protein [Mucilaginibacter gotjawali]MBB3058622.1 hypothetical protein [Mucilaginibacter gotjawali]BAU52411.1 hypothetical protein MgSA37_00568 [Mucilaginibacter gotjawali]
MLFYLSGTLKLPCVQATRLDRRDLVEAFEIVFKNGASIKLTNMLIGTSDFQPKFQDSMGNATLPFSYAKKSILKML